MVTNIMVPPKIEGEATTQKYGKFTISPLEQGFGITIGHALRRVLLSSLPGAAVTSIRVSDVHHEFSAIPHVREDMTQLILQVKQLRLKLIDTDSARLYTERGLGTSYEAAARTVAAMTPVRRIGTVDDVADLVAYLASDGAGFLTAQTIVIDGGLTSVSPLDRVAPPS